MKATYTKTKHPNLYRTTSGDWLVVATYKTQGRQRRATATLPAETPLHELLATQAQLKNRLEVAAAPAPAEQGDAAPRITVRLLSRSPRQPASPLTMRRSHPIQPDATGSRRMVG